MDMTKPLYASVFIRDTITVAVSTDYSDAKETMINLLQDNFNPKTDDALIFKHEGEGEGEAVFNYRAYLNGEEQPEPASDKQTENEGELDNE